VLEYATHLDPTMYEVHVASCVDDGTLLPAFEQTEVHLFVGSKHKQGGRLAILRDLKKYVREIRPDIIHTHLMSGDTVGYLLKRTFPSITWISTLHNTEYDRPWYYRAVWRFILQRADKIVAVSDGVKTYAEKTFHMLPERIIMIPNGIDTARWKHIDTKLFANIPYQLATIGRLEEQKGHTYLLDALASLPEQNWEYHLYGDGSLRDNLSKQAQDLGIASNICMHGNVDNLPEELATIDLVIQPSLWEGMSLTVMEAIAAGKPVLATFPAAEGILEDTNTGYIVSPADPQMLRVALERILSHTDEAIQIAKAGRKKALKDFDINKHIERIEKIYHSVLL